MKPERSIAVNTFHVHLLKVTGEDLMEMRYRRLFGDEAVKGHVVCHIAPGENYAGYTYEDLLALGTGMHEMTFPKPGVPAPSVPVEREA
jgi:hypothetical protein